MHQDFQNKNLLSSKKELKLSIEAMTQCAAGCAGCFLTPELRAKSNLWELEKLQKARFFAQKFIAENLAYYNQIDDLLLNFGQGDYLMLNEAELSLLLDEVCNWFPEKSSLYFTSSGITRHEKFKAALDVFYDKTLQYKLPFSLSIVLDSSKLNTKFLPIYEKNISYARHKLGVLDLHMNLGLDVVKNISPVAMDSFLKTNKISFMTVNFVPSYHMKLTKEDWHQINDWLIQWLELWHPDNYELNFVNTVRHHFGAFSENNSYKDQLISSNKVVQRELVIDYDGNAYTQQEGIGDIALSDRNGFSSFLNIFDNYQEILPQIEHHQNNINKTLLKSFTRAHSCSNCDYAKVCTQLGVLAYKNTIGFDMKKDTCDLNIHKLITAILTKKKNETLKIIGDNFDKIRVQKGLINTHLDVKEVDYETSPISLDRLNS